MFKNPFLRNDRESRKKNDDRNKAPRAGSGPSSRDNRKRSDVASKPQEAANGYLRSVLGRQFAVMPGLAEDIGILLQKAKEKLEKLRKIDASLFGRGQVGIYVNQCTGYLVKSQKIQREIGEYIRNEEKELKGEGPRRRKENGQDTEDTDGIKAYNKAFKFANGCSPETWETTRAMKKISEDLELAFIRYDGVLKSDDCQKNQIKSEKVKETISMLRKAIAKHGEAQSILAKDNP